MASLTPQEKQDYESLMEQIREHEHSALKWIELLYQLKESGLWRCMWSDWADFCYEELGYSRAKAYRYVACGKALKENKEEFEKNPPKSIRQIQARAKVSSVRRANLEYVGTENEEGKKPMATARLLPEAEIEFNNPPPHPEPPPVAEIPKATVTVPIWNELHAICNYVNQLQQKDSRYMEAPFRKLVSMLDQFKRHMQIPLPGILDQVPEKTAARGTQKQLEAYCVSQGLNADDGAWLYDKMLYSGWKNDGKPIKDWQALVRAWKRINIFPSQKQRMSNGNGSAPAKPKGFSIDREIARAKKEGLYDT